MTSDVKAWPLSTVCPHCAAETATPARVSECTDKTVTVVVRCPDCDAEWTLTSGAATPFLRQKPDRRVSN